MPFEPRELLTCPVGSDLYRMMVARMKHDGRYKYLPRGKNIGNVLRDKAVSGASTKPKEPVQVWLPYRDDSEFSDGL